MRAWLDSHPSNEPRVIAYEVKRCCGGGKICNVRVRGRSRNDDVRNTRRPSWKTAPGSWSIAGRRHGCHRTLRSRCAGSDPPGISISTSAASSGARSSTESPRSPCRAQTAGVSRWRDLAEHARDLGNATTVPVGAEGRDCCLAVPLGHLEVACGVGRDVRVVILVSSAESEGGELSTPHVRFQLLER